MSDLRPPPWNVPEPGPIDWPDPTPRMLEDPRFEAVWKAIRTWDINVPRAYAGYSGATGNHVRAILDALDKIPRTESRKPGKIPEVDYEGPREGPHHP
jgi:hypothetical protein